VNYIRHFLAVPKWRDLFGWRFPELNARQRKVPRLRSGRQSFFLGGDWFGLRMLSITLSTVCHFGARGYRARNLLFGGRLRPFGLGGGDVGAEIRLACGLQNDKGLKGNDKGLERFALSSSGHFRPPKDSGILTTILFSKLSRLFSSH
jgi:hypothetical protein